MTTFTISGFSIGYDWNSPVDTYNPATLSVFFSSGDAPTFRYTMAGTNDDGIPLVTIDVQGYGTFNGTPVDIDEEYIVNVDWSGNNTTVLVLYDEDPFGETDSDYFFVLAGDPFNVTSINSWNAISDSITDIAAVTSGAYRPNVDISFADIGGVTVTEADVVYGWEDPENIALGIGNDRAYGGEGNDTLRGEGGNDRLMGDDGSDRLDGGVGRDILFGGAGADTVLGGGGNDRLDGGAGTDRMQGGAGNDWLTGGSGNDVLAGGAGRDRFVFNSNDGNDTITGFQNNRDKFVIESGAEAFSEVRITDAGNDVLIEFGDVSITLVNVNHTLFGQNDFLFS